MSLLDFILRRPSTYKLRKEYDRLRERVDKIRDVDRRLEILRLLDQLEPSIISLEEHHMSHYERKKIYGYVEPGLRKAKFMISETKRATKEERNGFKGDKQNIR